MFPRLMLRVCGHTQERLPFGNPLVMDWSQTGAFDFDATVISWSEENDAKRIYNHYLSPHKPVEYPVGEKSLLNNTVMV